MLRWFAVALAIWIGFVGCGGERAEVSREMPAPTVTSIGLRIAEEGPPRTVEDAARTLGAAFTEHSDNGVYTIHHGAGGQLFSRVELRIPNQPSAESPTLLLLTLSAQDRAFEEFAVRLGRDFTLLAPGAHAPVASVWQVYSRAWGSLRFEVDDSGRVRRIVAERRGEPVPAPTTSVQ